jgi:predicted DNA-binding protein (MmcQ/YjbR family)
MNCASRSRGRYSPWSACPAFLSESDPEEFSELLEHEGVVPAPYVGRYKWVMLVNLGALPKAEIDRCIKKSYAMVAAKAKPRRTRIKKIKPTRKSRNS